jgi:hypothetical protein
VLVLGNLTMLAAPAAFEAPTGEGYVVRGPDKLVYGASKEKFSIQFADDWYPVERHNSDYWVWSGGTSTLTLRNPQAMPLVVRLRFTLNVNAPRSVWLRLNGATIWATEMNDHSTLEVTIAEVALPPGASTLEFFTDIAPSLIGSDSRLLAYRMQNLQVDVQRAVPPK